jgi:hypothetical protein
MPAVRQEGHIDIEPLALALHQAPTVAPEAKLVVRRWGMPLLQVLPKCRMASQINYSR